MSAGGMSISDSVVKWIRSNLKEGSTILELGSGTGTEVLSKNYKMISIEENEKWVGKYGSDYLHAPIVDDWYDIEKVKDFLKNKTYDAILVDGPAAGIRSKFFENIELFNTDVLLIFDDVERMDDRKNADMVSEHVERKLIEVVPPSMSVILPK
jgi:hypothetical protein